MRPRLLDLFCGAGGAAMGYHRAGFEVVGVDINPQPRFPFEFHRGDALEFAKEHGHEFDAIHASPPCQAYSALRKAHPGRDYPDLVADTRLLLEASGTAWVLENVPGAPLRRDLMLCGSMFGLGATAPDGTVRHLRRHRIFESSGTLAQPECRHVGEAIGIYGGGPTSRRGLDGGRIKARGAYQGGVAENRAAMGVDWMNRKELAQSIPPAYTEYIGGML